jgi:hypothetical protein
MLKDAMSKGPQMDNESENRLSTVSDLNPMKVLERFDNAPVILIAVGIWSRDSYVGLLEQKGKWVQAAWHSVLSRIPDLEGCRLLWNTFFFACGAENEQVVKEQFQDVLSNLYDPELKSFCVMAEVKGTPADKMLVLDDMQSEIWGERDFGMHDHIKYRFIDGSLWTSDD